jgi:peptidoglycan/LPS O-acetylase OafA/YrhL
VPAAAPVPDAVAPPPRHPRFPLVDGARAIAVLCVVAVHAAVSGGALTGSFASHLLAHLNIGVTIFFLISGFLLYRPFVAHRAGGAPSPRTGDYAKRRILRIYPAYWVVLTFVIVVPGLTGVIDGTWWPMYALVHTLPVYSGRSCVDVPLQCGVSQTWSLVVELTFYLVLPAYAWAAGRLTRGLGRRTWVRAELAVLAALSAVSVVLHTWVLDPVPAWFGSSVLGYVLWFALGMSMAVASVAAGDGARLPVALRAVGTRPVLLWAAAATGYVALSTWLPATPFLTGRADVLVSFVASGAIAALILAPAVFTDTSASLPRRVLAHPVLAWLGLISYGIFLWHFFITFQLGSQGAVLSFPLVLVGTLALCIPCAAASYYVVERPLLGLKHRRLRDVSRRRRPVAAEAAGESGSA